MRCGWGTAQPGGGAFGGTNFGGAGLQLNTMGGGGGGAGFTTAPP